MRKHPQSIHDFIRSQKRFTKMQCLFKNSQPRASTLSRIEYTIERHDLEKMFGVLDVPDDSAQGAIKEKLSRYLSNASHRFEWNEVGIFSKEFSIGWFVYV